MKVWIKRILIGVGALLLIGALYAAFAPIPMDAELPQDKWGAGASSVLPAYSGLQREFPELNGETNADEAALGRMLFFDPILSKNDDLSCATCHHPDLGFSDGLQVAIGAGGQGFGSERAGGEALPRNTMSLWNVGYESNFFWDGRANALEDQMLIPMTAQNEMAADPNELVTELKAIPEYVTLFDKAFGSGPEAVTFQNVEKAIAAFERTFESKNSPFDRYAAGEFNALTAQQRRGLALFRSAATRCFECHAAPTFGSDSFFLTGVPDLPGQAHDTGRQAVASDGQDGAFKAPTLRNIALSAPYMHDGSFKTLEEVIDFYAKGGGRVNGFPVDRQIVPFDLNVQEKEDLIAFLYALTDESALPEIPQSVPSGLPVVTTLPNPAREVVRQMNVKLTEAGSVAQHVPATITVGPNETIQQAADRSGPGDTIKVPYGIYKESVVLDWSDIKLIGLPNEKGEWPIIEGENKRSDGVIASGNNFEMAYFQVKNYTSNGVLAEGVTGVHLHDLYVENTGVYGVYPVRSTNVELDHIKATKMNDAGIYAGKCENVVIHDTETYGNVIGVELENTVNGEVLNNYAHDNTVGIFIDLLPQLPSKVSLYTKVHDNISENNNGANFATPGSSQALIPAGTGMLVLAADHVEVYNNTIRGNKSGGLAVFNLAIGFSTDEIDVGPNPEHLYAHDNTYENNAFDPDPFVKNLLGRGFDIIWDGSGGDNRFDEKVSSSFPPMLPKSTWPTPLYNLYWRVINFVVKLVS